MVNAIVKVHAQLSARMRVFRPLGLCPGVESGHLFPCVRYLEELPGRFPRRLCACASSPALVTCPRSGFSRAPGCEASSPRGFDLNFPND